MTAYRDQRHADVTVPRWGEELAFRFEVWR